MKTLQNITIFSALLLFIFFVTQQAKAQQSIAIGEREFTPHPSAILEMQSVNKGLLIPRLTMLQRLQIPTNAQAVGLLVFQTDEEVGFHYFNGLTWRFLEPNVNPKNLNLAPVAFTGNWNDLTGRPKIIDLPSLAAVATTGRWQDLDNRPAIPTHLRDLQQDDNFYMTVNRQQLERWNNLFVSAEFSGSWNDLTDRPDFHIVATSGNYSNLRNLPQFHQIAFTGSWNDLEDKPNIADIPNMADVAFTGNWSDLTDRPVIPSHLRDLAQNDSFMTVNRVQVERWNNKSDFTGNWNDLTNRPHIPNHLRDLVQDENFYMTVNRSQVISWDNKSTFTGSWNDLNNRPSIFTHLRDFIQDDITHIFVTNVQIERWDNAAFASAFSGHFDDLVGKPNFAPFAFTGEWNNLQGRPIFHQIATSGSFNHLRDMPTIPRHLSELVQDSQHRTITFQQRNFWNNKSDFSGNFAQLQHRPDFNQVSFSGSWNDLHNRPNFHRAALSGSFNDLENRPIIHSAAQSGNFNDLIGVPTWGGFEEINSRLLQIGFENIPQNVGSQNQFARVDHVHTIENTIETQNIGTNDNRMVSSELLHNTFNRGIGSSSFITQLDILPGGFMNGNYLLNIKPNVQLRGDARVENNPNTRPNHSTIDYVAPVTYLTAAIAAVRSELIAELDALQAELGSADDFPVHTIIMVNTQHDVDRLNADPCWNQVTQMTGRFPIGAAVAGQFGGAEFQNAHGNIVTVNPGAHTDNFGITGQSFVQLTIAQMPSHTHQAVNGNFRVRGIGGSQGMTASAGTNTCSDRFWGFTGGDHSHENRPPFMGMVFFQKAATAGC